MVNGLALSVTAYAVPDSPEGGTSARLQAASPSQSSLRDASSPKVGALGSPRKLHLFAKASPFGRGVTAGDGEGEPPLFLVPDGHAAGVGVQALALGKIGDAGSHLAQRFPGVVEEAGFFYKVVYAQGA